MHKSGGRTHKSARTFFIGAHPIIFLAIGPTRRYGPYNGQKNNGSGYPLLCGYSAATPLSAACLPFGPAVASLSSVSGFMDATYRCYPLRVFFGYLVLGIGYWVLGIGYWVMSTKNKKRLRIIPEPFLFYSI